jgi:hypothetical protein
MPDIAVTLAIFVAGFFSGYALRALKSYTRRHGYWLDRTSR